MTEPAAHGESSSAEFGLRFRTAREDAGMTRGEVAEALHLDVAVVSAIEDGRFADLPLRPYARGYVRNYARVVGLDADELARRFDAADTGRPEPSVVVPRHRMTPKSELALRPLAVGYAAIVAVLLIALGAVLWTAWRVQDWQFPFLADDSVAPPTQAPGTESPARPPNVSQWPIAADGVAEDGVAGEVRPVASAGEESATPAVALEGERLAVLVEPQETQARAGEVPPDEAEQVSRPTSAEVADAAPAPVDGTLAAAGLVGELTVVFDDESWVSVDDATGRQLFGDLGQNGRTVTVAGPVPLSVLVGNALAVRVEFDGQSVDLGPFTRDNNVARFELGGG